MKNFLRNKWVIAFSLGWTLLGLWAFLYGEWYHWSDWLDSL